MHINLHGMPGKQNCTVVKPNKKLGAYMGIFVTVISRVQGIYGTKSKGIAWGKCLLIIAINLWPLITYPTWFVLCCYSCKLICTCASVYSDFNTSAMIYHRGVSLSMQHTDLLICHCRKQDLSRTSRYLASFPGSPRAQTKNWKERGVPGKIYHVRNVIDRENLITCGRTNELAHASLTEYTCSVAKALWLTKQD